MANIKDAINRNEAQDQIMIGEVCDRAYRSKFGEVLRAIVNGETTRILSSHESNPTDRGPISADRLLGRLEGMQKIINVIEIAISNAEQLKRPVQEEEHDG